MTYEKERIDRNVHGTGCHLLFDPPFFFLVLGYEIAEAFEETKRAVGEFACGKRANTVAGGYFYASPGPIGDTERKRWRAQNTMITKDP